MAGRRETNDLKPIDKAIHGMVSESPGRSESERRSGPESAKPRRSSLQSKGEGSMVYGKLADAMDHSGGVKAAAR